MTGFRSVRDYANAMDEGRYTYSTWRKSPSQTTTAGPVFDLSMSPGNPVPQYYAATPLKATRLAQSTDGGLFHGGDAPSGMSKYLHQFTTMASAATALPMAMTLCDYLLFYPFIDEGTTDPQILDNSIGLSRYADGEGVRIMAVSVAGRTGGQSFIIEYTNQDGVTGRVAGPFRENAVSVIGTVVTSDVAAVPVPGDVTGAFLPLQAGDSGVRSLDSVTMLGGDVGLFALVLVKPIAQHQLFEQTAPCESSYFTDYGVVPKIENDAYLNLLCTPRGTLAATLLHGDITVVWN